MRLGVHLSVSGALKNAPERGLTIGCQSLQIFCANPRGWSKKPLDQDEVQQFHSSVQRAGIDPVVVHATYLINLAAPDPEMYKLSVESFLEELRRSAQLGAKFYVVHSGSHKGTGEEGGRKRIREALKRAANEIDPKNCPHILIENTAGTANSLGNKFEELAMLLEGDPHPNNGVCMDTCHALAAGYEIRTPEGLAQTMARIDKTIGFARLKCLHINDSKGDLGSCLDRHEHIGQGTIGIEGFRNFFLAKKLWGLPGILETPQDNPDDDRKDLWRIIELAVEAGAVDRRMLERMPTAELEAVPPKKPAGVETTKSLKRKSILKKVSQKAKAIRRAKR